jgi:hypothetical protein
MRTKTLWIKDEYLRLILAGRNLCSPQTVAAVGLHSFIARPFHRQIEKRQADCPMLRRQFGQPPHLS